MKQNAISLFLIRPQADVCQGRELYNTVKYYQGFLSY